MARTDGIENMDTYQVIVDDNFHYMDTDERYVISGFVTAEHALAKCKAIVEQCLKDCAKPGDTPEQIYGSYQAFGEDPWVGSPPGKPPVRFSAWDYARAEAYRFVTEVQ